MKNNIVRVIYITLLAIAILGVEKGYNVYAKEQINFKNITIEDGLIQGTVEALFQDSKGYIWIGTNEGLCRYNGYQFNVYRVEENNNSINNNYILDIKEDEDGDIWVATADGLSRIRNNGQSIINYLDKSDNGNLTNANVNSILITKDNKILAATADGLNIYNEEKDCFEEIYRSEISNTYIESITEDEDGNIWLGTNTGVNKINITSGKVDVFLLSSENENENEKTINEIYKVYYDKNGYIWVGTRNAGAYSINIKTNEIKRYVHNDDKTSLGGSFIKSFLRDDNGQMWIGTDLGLSKLDEESDTFITYKNKIYDRNSIVDDNIFSLIQDQTGLMWIGTYAGISIFNPESEIQNYKNDPFDNSTISNNMITALYEDDEGYLWIGSKYKGIDVLNGNKDKIINISSETMNIFKTDDIYDIDGNKEEIYIATDKGITIINKSSKTYKNYSDFIVSGDKTVKRLLYDDGYLWVGTKEGLYILNLETKESIDLNYIIKKYSYSDNYIGDIFKDSSGEYWIGMFRQGGLIRLNPVDNTVTVYKNIEGNKNSLSNNSIRVISEDNYGNILIGTSFGLNILNKSGDKFLRYTTKYGLANNTIYGILTDFNGAIWCSTNMGISKIDSKSGVIINLDVTDGLQSNEFNGNAYLKSSNGDLLFGGINGFNIISPKDIKSNNKIYSLILDEVKVNGVKRNIKDINKLEYYENNIFIEYFLPNYKNVSGIQYYYCLDENGDEWFEMDGNSITLSNLSPGDYIFKVKARSNNGLITEESSIHFYIKYPFWASKYAILLYIGIIVAFVINSINKVKKLDNLVELRTKELSEEMDRNSELFNRIIDLEKRKNSYLINLSHELRTPLNVIYSTEQLIKELNKNEEGIGREKLDHYMSIIKNNTKRLLKIINDLIDSSKIEHGSYNINIEEIDIVYVVEEAALSMKEYIGVKDIELIVDPEIEEKIIEADKSEIERCIVNIVGNAYKFTEPGGVIKVVIIDLGDSVRIEISDTGIGIDKKYHDLIFNRFNQVIDPSSEVKKGSGLGLTITKKIIDLHNGDIYVKSIPGQGSKFIIVLPVKQER